MDGIQAYKGDAAPPSPSRPSIALAPAAINPAAVKTTSNYLKALKRRFWVVLAVAVPLAITTSILVLRQPPVYVAKVEIEIKPPELDQWLTTLVATESRSPRRVEPGQLRRQPRGEAHRPDARRSGRQRPGDRAQGEPLRRPGLRAHPAPAHRPAGQEDQHVSRVASRGPTRP